MVSESELRAAVVDMARRAGWLVFSLPIAKTRRPVKDAVGYPDLTLARDGKVIWLELKTQKGVVDGRQFEWLKHLPDMHVIRPNDLDRLSALLA